MKGPVVKKGRYNMSGRPTDHANLNLTQFNLEVLRGQTGGKIIWQPRIGCWLDDKKFSGQRIPEPYTGLTLPEIYRSLGCSNRIYEFNSCFKEIEDEQVRIITNELGNGRQEIVIETPVGSQRAIYQRSVNSPYHITVKWPIESETEMQVAAWRSRHRKWRWDQQEYERLCGQWHGLGVPTMYMPRVNVQRLFIDEMGVERAIYALMDWTSTCQGYFEALSFEYDQLIDVINASPIEVVNFGDNIHASTLSPAFFEKYVLPEYKRRCDRLHRADKFCHAHWDGHCAPLLRYARETGLDGIEAITPKPQGDVVLEEIKEALGDMFLLDGIPAIYFDQMWDEQVLIDCAKKCIDLFAPHLILGISDEISSTGEIERIRTVGKIVDDYNARASSMPT